MIYKFAHILINKCWSSLIIPQNHTQEVKMNDLFSHYATQMRCVLMTYFHKNGKREFIPELNPVYILINTLKVSRSCLPSSHLSVQNKKGYYKGRLWLKSRVLGNTELWHYRTKGFTKTLDITLNTISSNALSNWHLYHRMHFIDRCWKQLIHCSKWCKHRHHTWNLKNFHLEKLWQYKSEYTS